MKKRRTGFRKKRSPPPTKHILIITMIIFVILIWVSVKVIDNGITPALMNIAEIKTKDFATQGINEAVKYAETFQFDDVSRYTRNNEGNITSWDIDPGAINKINRIATDKVNEYFKRVNSGIVPNPDESDLNMDYGDTIKKRQAEDPTLIEIPLGLATGNTVLANLGPKIPVNFQLAGNVQTDVVVKKKPVGINTVSVELYVKVVAQVQVVVPFSTSVAKVKTRVFIVSGLVNMGIPEYYGGGGNNPPIAIPKDDFEDDLKKNQ